MIIVVEGYTYQPGKHQTNYQRDTIQLCAQLVYYYMSLCIYSSILLQFL